jgi:hypothetical protein
MLRGRRRLGAAQRDQVAPQKAAAVNLDEAGQGHGRKPGRPYAALDAAEAARQARAPPWRCNALAVASCTNAQMAGLK